MGDGDGLRLSEPGFIELKNEHDFFDVAIRKLSESEFTELKNKLNFFNAGILKILKSKKSRFRQLLNHPTNELLSQ